MTIHLRQNTHPRHATTQDAASSSSSSSSYKKPSVVGFVLLLLSAVFFVSQKGEASKAQEIEQRSNQKPNFETVHVALGGPNDAHTNTNTNTKTTLSPSSTTTTITTSKDDTDTKSPTSDDNQQGEESKTTPTPTPTPGSIRATTKAPSPATQTTNEQKTPFCTLDCKDLKQKREAEFGGDLSNRQTMLELATKARNDMVSTLKQSQHYGDYFDAIFQHGFQPIGGSSQSRLQRKLQIKALEVQNKFANEETTCQQDCEPLVVNLNKHDFNALPVTTNDNNVYYERYVWATGGHSAAAGHGNLFNESYTAFLERDMKPVFASIGVQFQGRNFAMGGTRSGLEIAMCFEQIFGTDVDFFSWDYGMTDGRKDSLLFHYGYRGALNPGRPAMLGVWTNGWKGRDERLLDLEQAGLAIFHRPPKSIDAMNAAFPDSGEVTQAELEALPDYVRNFKCQGQIEKGDPHCHDHKYSTGICDNRASKAGWHPGIKQHGVDGHMLALFLADSLIKALQGLVDHSNQDAESLLKQLRAEEDELMEKIKDTKLGDQAWKIYDGGANGGSTLEDLDSDVDLELLYKGKSICHTGRVPAITRFMGYLTNTDKVGGSAPYQSEQYDTGIEKTEADTTNANGQMRLVWEFNQKDRQTCEVPLRPDYKDFFYTHHRDGMVKLNFPNEKEKTAYDYNQSEMKGLVILVLNECDWGKCQEGDLKEVDIENGNVSIKINSVDVAKVINIGSGGLVLKHKSGVHWEPSRNDDYEIAVEVMAPDSYLRISSIIIY